MNAAYEQTIDEIHDAIRELRAKIEHGGSMVPSWMKDAQPR